jgi:hypothetical protein
MEPAIDLQLLVVKSDEPTTVAENNDKEMEKIIEGHEKSEVNEVEIISPTIDIRSNKSSEEIAVELLIDSTETDVTAETTKKDNQVDEAVVSIIVGTPIRKSSRRRSLTPSKIQPIAVASRKTPRKVIGKFCC